STHYAFFVTRARFGPSTFELVFISPLRCTTLAGAFRDVEEIEEIGSGLTFCAKKESSRTGDMRHPGARYCQNVYDSTIDPNWWLSG
ncbi:MAG: hypothetical protein ACR2RL_09210, partial [Gammaproteobacteria bacterium]